MIKRILMYGYPFYMILIEYALRRAISLESAMFIGPTLAAVGVSLLLPLLVPKKREFPFAKKTILKIEQLGGRVIYRRESIFIDLVWPLIFILTAAWVYSLYLSSQRPENSLLSVSLFIGLANYFSAVALSEIKEKI